MKATLLCVGALAVVLMSATLAPADEYYPPYPRIAPDMCGPCFYCTNAYGMAYGPSYSVTPSFAPWNGFRPDLCNQCGQGNPGFPVHPWARSPRDYFMWDSRTSPQDYFMGR
jgi:hypothetical protein